MQFDPFSVNFKSSLMLLHRSIAQTATFVLCGLCFVVAAPLQLVTYPETGQTMLSCIEGTCEGSPKSSHISGLHSGARRLHYQHIHAHSIHTHSHRHDWIKADKNSNQLGSAQRREAAP